MARRTPEEILEQREAWLARKAAREAGEDVPIQPPLKPGEVAKTAPVEADDPASAEEATPESQSEAPESAEATPSEPESQTPVEETPEALKPKPPKQRRSPEEIKAQREAFLAAKAAKAAGAAPAPKKEKTEPAKPKPAAAAAPATAKATPPPKKASRAPARPQRKPKAPPKAEPVDPNLTRREFLNYAWLASIGLFAVGSVGVGLWFAFPNFKAGEFGGKFPIGAAQSVLPGVNADPIPFTDGKFWLVNIDGESPDGEPRVGVLALYKVCTHLGCLYEWVNVTNRYECPCHGSKFALTGDYLAGPARRSLDRFVIEAVAPDGSIKTTNANGEPLVVDPEDQLVIDTGQRILGSSDIVPA